MSKITQVNQVYIFSIVSLITSLIGGLGLIYAIPTLVLAYKENKIANKIDNIKIEKGIIFCLSSIVLSLISFAIAMALFNK